MGNWDMFFVVGNTFCLTENADKLPENLYICGSLTLCGSKVEKLPKTLYVTGDLDISYKKIKELPQVLYVGGNLDISNTQITKLHNNIYVGGRLFLRDVDIVNYPITHVRDVPIFLDLKDKTKVCIDGFKGTKEEAKDFVEKCFYLDKDKKKFLEKVEWCFETWEHADKELKTTETNTQGCDCLYWARTFDEELYSIHAPNCPNRNIEQEAKTHLLNLINIIDNKTNNGQNLSKEFFETYQKARYFTGCHRT